MNTKLTRSNLDFGGLLGLLRSLKETGQLGYAIARNIRILDTELTEYHQAIQDWARRQDYLEGESFSLDEMYADPDMRAICDTKLEICLFQVEEPVFVNGTLTSDQMAQLLWMVHSEEGDAL